MAGLVITLLQVNAIQSSTSNDDRNIVFIVTIVVVTTYILIFIFTPYQRNRFINDPSLLEPTGCSDTDTMENLYSFTAAFTIPFSILLAIIIVYFFYSPIEGSEIFGGIISGLVLGAIDSYFIAWASDSMARVLAYDILRKK